MIKDHLRHISIYGEIFIILQIETLQYGNIYKSENTKFYLLILSVLRF